MNPCPKCGAPERVTRTRGKQRWACESVLDTGAFVQSWSCAQIAALQSQLELERREKGELLDRVLSICGEEHDWYYQRSFMAEAAGIRDLLPKLMQLRNELTPHEVPDGR